MSCLRASIRLGFLAGVLALTGCARETLPQNADKEKAPIRQVTVVRPLRKSIARTTTQPGYIEAFEEAPIFARVSGYVERLAVDIGDRVQGPKYDSDGRRIEPGQVLAELSVPELVDDVEQKQSLVVHAETAIAQATAAVEVAETAVGAARARRREADAMVARTEAEAERWRLEYERIAKLVASQSIEQKLADEARSSWRAAKASQTEAAARIDAADAAVAEAAASVRKSQTDEQVARAQHRVRQSDLRHAQTMLDYATLRAPFDGVVVRRNVNTGHFVQAEKAGQNQPLFSVVQADVVRAFLDVPETFAPYVDPGDAAEIVVEALGQRSFPAKVTRVSWSLDAMTRTLHAEVDIPNADGALRPGMYAHVTVIADEKKDALVLPATAVAGEKKDAHCVAIKEGKAVFVPIELGLRGANEVEIVSGLTGDETIVSAGVGSIVEGQPLAPAPQPES